MWKKYKKKFLEMVKWMDMVDISIKKIMKEVNKIEEFEKERDVLKKICKEVDNKREEMKWLVKNME